MTEVRPYPLTWPVRIPRTPDHKRKRAAFGHMKEKSSRRADGSSYCRKEKRPWTFAMTRDDLLAELDRMRDVIEVVISTDMALRQDGLPHGGRVSPDDPGVALYFKRRANASADVRSYTMACDQYDRLADNTRALVLTIESLRRIERHGSSDLMEQAFSGFAALPAAQTGLRPWRDILGLIGNVSLEAAEFAYKKLLIVRHPDRGGSHEDAVELNDAIRRAREEFE